MYCEFQTNSNMATNSLAIVAIIWKPVNATITRLFCSNRSARSDNMETRLWTRNFVPHFLSSFRDIIETSKLLRKRNEMQGGEGEGKVPTFLAVRLDTDLALLTKTLWGIFQN